MSCTILSRPGAFLLEKAPPGEWYLLAHSVPVRTVSTRTPHVDPSKLATATVGPIAVRPETMVDGVDVQLRSMRSVDPPILTVLLDVRTVAL